MKVLKELLAEYDSLVEIYQNKYASKFSAEDLFEYNEVLFSAHSCAIERNSFSVNETRELKEHGLNLKLQNKSMLEAFEIKQLVDNVRRCRKINYTSRFRNRI